ncbi:hypothetical protein DFH09DRAFT_1468901 [Mycena vulgaris]|nr:hypothetical protein DFH09DRAFT_1468901 [Mycena vulgaris]
MGLSSLRRCARPNRARVPPTAVSLREYENSTTYPRTLHIAAPAPPPHGHSVRSRSRDSSRPNTARKDEEGPWCVVPISQASHAPPLDHAKDDPRAARNRQTRTHAPRSCGPAAPERGGCCGHSPCTAPSASARHLRVSTEWWRAHLVGDLAFCVLVLPPHLRALADTAVCLLRSIKLARFVKNLVIVSTSYISPIRVHAPRQLSPQALAHKQGVRHRDSGRHVNAPVVGRGRAVAAALPRAEGKAHLAPGCDNSTSPHPRDCASAPQRPQAFAGNEVSSNCAGAVPSRLRRAPFFKPNAPETELGDRCDPARWVRKGIEGQERFFMRWEGGVVELLEGDEVMVGIPESIAGALPSLLLDLYPTFTRCIARMLFLAHISDFAYTTHSSPPGKSAVEIPSASRTRPPSSQAPRGARPRQMRINPPHKSRSPLATSTASHIPVALKNATALLKAPDADRNHLTPACAPPRTALGARLACSPACNGSASNEWGMTSLLARARGPSSTQIQRCEARDGVDGLHARSRIALPPRSDHPPTRNSSPVVPRAMALGELLEVTVACAAFRPATPRRPASIPCEADAVGGVSGRPAHAYVVGVKTPAGAVLLYAEFSLEVGGERCARYVAGEDAGGTDATEQIEAVVDGCMRLLVPGRQPVGTALALLPEVAL